MPRAIIFDLFHTLLYDEGTGLRERAIEIARHAGIAEEDLLRGWQATRHEADRGAIRSLVGRVRRALSEVGHEDPDGALADRLTGVLLARYSPALYADVRQALVEVRRRGYKVGLVSNLSRSDTPWLQEFELDAYFDAIVLSCEAGMAKPERGIYLLAAERLETKPEECVFVDNAPAYLAGARDVGMTTVQITRAGSEWMHAEAGPTDAAPDLSIAELRELLDWLPEKAAQ